MMHSLVRSLVQAAVCSLAVLASAPALAQADYPKQPIRMIVGFAPGGISDVLARALAAKVSNQIGQGVIVENRPGAGTTIAGDMVAKAPADGYTIWLQDITTHAINASLYPRLPYDTVKDFSPIALVASTPLMLVVHPSSPARSVRDLAAQAKADPGKMSYGSSGNGTIIHLASEMLKASQGLEAVHVPYKGSGPATQAILAGDVSFVFSTMPPAVSNARAGKLRALAVTTAKRVPAAPDVPTMGEAGVPNFELVLYTGILGPKGMDPAIVRRLNAEFAKAVQSEEIRKVYENLGADPMSVSPETFTEMIGKEMVRFAPVVKASGAKVD
ncbi:Bug family tripartite tricarboxylate transporter substrate binding protein [Ramlibacter alkalitolerans]|uniref:Tripartite tricarboxylate transporter substrate binding protein n=1 Tax=Ramlibacter alkalitolerans TaxID=2039631 RepID=A0ABS1JNU8_9BURK|nr:tripartite tricarboxylate transporter substrate binding protein [Ramlibacter alkalitolerans]MBL0425811.1 tripartite tricarboxylate transporter substrate binding protein [Ramlibacter alkalitolerans]